MTLNDRIVDQLREWFEPDELPPDTVAAFEDLLNDDTLSPDQLLAKTIRLAFGTAVFVTDFIDNRRGR